MLSPTKRVVEVVVWVEISKQVAQRVGEELKIPVFLYEKSASSPHRRKLPDIRKGEYEGLVDKLNDPDWVPDFGPKKVHIKDMSLQV